MSNLALVLFYLMGSLTWAAVLGLIFWLAVRGGSTTGDGVLKGPRGGAMSSLQRRESMYGQTA